MYFSPIDPDEHVDPVVEQNVEVEDGEYLQDSDEDDGE